MNTKKHIYNLPELILALNVSNLDTEFTNLLNKIRFNFKDIEHLCFWDADSYSKISIGSGTNYELVLICWENMQESLIHNHNLEQAWTYILKGEITEKIYDHISDKEIFNLKEEKILYPKKISFLNQSNEIYHQLINSYKGRSVSLHLYIK